VTSHKDRESVNPSGETTPSQEFATAFLSIMNRSLRMESPQAVIDSILSSIKWINGLKEVVFEVVSSDAKSLFEESWLRGVGPDKKHVRWSDLEVKEANRISTYAYFSRAAAFKDRPASGLKWLPTDLLKLAVVDVTDRPIAWIGAEGVEGREVPTKSSIDCMSAMIQLAAMAIRRRIDATARDRQSTKMIRKTDLMEDLLRISSRIVSEKDIKPLADTILTSVSTLFGFRNVTLVVYDETIGAFRWLALFGYPENASKETRSRTIPTEAILEDLRESKRIGRSVYFTPREEVSPGSMVYFVESKQRPSPGADKDRKPGDYLDGDTLAFALHDSTGRIVGVIYPSFPIDGKVPDKETIETIEVFTSLAEVSIENARLALEKDSAMRQSAERTEQLSRIFDLTSDILYVRDLDQLLQQVLETLAQLLGIRRMVLGIRREDKGVFEVRAVYGYSEEAAEEIKKVTYPIGRVDYIVDPKGRPRGLSPIQWHKKLGRFTYYMPVETVIAQPGDMVYYPEPDLLRLPRKGEGYWHEMDYIDTFINDREGVITAYLEILRPRDDRIPDAETVEIIEIFASIAGVAIENARMFQTQIESRKSAEFYTDLLSHDIKNHNQAIIGYMDLLKAKLGKDAQTALIDKTIDQVMKVSRLATDVRTMSRLTWGGTRLSRTDIGAVLTDCIRSLPQYFMTRQIRFNGPPESGKYYTVADEMLKELFVNILTNAAKYDAHDPLEIDISVESKFGEQGRSHVVSISDHGQGVPDDLKEEIFERFVQGPKKKGSGLGLYIVKTLARRYDGRAWVEDRVRGDHSQGAVFKVELPAAD
jgi:signal transduction histidine kinase